MSVIAVINPCCGDKSAAAFFNDHVAHRLPPNTLITTDRNPVAIIQSAIKPLVVVLASGDGTLQEILRQLPTTSPPQISFVLIPCGTANALYSSLFPPAEDPSPAYRLQSLQAFLDRGSPTRLSLATLTFSSNNTISDTSIASVVVSTSLHAALVHDSEALREQHPGIERFKIAAERNSTKWFKSRVKLLPCSSTGTVQIYDRKSNSFISHPNSTGENSVLDLDGPFVYFLSIFNVDRLEPAFRIAPLVRCLPSDGPTCDLVVLRPLKDPSISEDSPDARCAFVAKVWQVLTGAYQDGSHIQLAYAVDGEVSADIDGPSVIEYFRCGGWEWMPDSDDIDAHLVCLDGAISSVSVQGKVTCAVETFAHQYSVYGPSAMNK